MNNLIDAISNICSSLFRRRARQPWENAFFYGNALILGSSGSGKTTLATRGVMVQCQRYKNAEVILCNHSSRNLEFLTKTLSRAKLRITAPETRHPYEPHMILVIEVSEMPQLSSQNWNDVELIAQRGDEFGISLIMTAQRSSDIGIAKSILAGYFNKAVIGHSDRSTLTEIFSYETNIDLLAKKAMQKSKRLKNHRVAIAEGGEDELGVKVFSLNEKGQLVVS